MKSVNMSEQVGGDAFDKVHELGAATVNDVLRKFDEKNWVLESQASANNEMCAPTLSLTQQNTDHVFWVSSYLDGNEPRYVNEFAYPLDEPGFFSRMLGRTHASPRTRDLGQTEARHALELFVGQKYSELIDHLRAT